MQSVGVLQFHLDGENARFKNGHARVETRVLKHWRVEMAFGPLLSNSRQRVSAF